jgi:hypothetical protein
MDNAAAMRDWGEDLERRIQEAKVRRRVSTGDLMVGAGLPDVDEVPVASIVEKPKGFLFSWPPQQNLKNTRRRRRMRELKVSTSWRAKESHKMEMNGGCQKCFAVEAVQFGAEGPGFIHVHCHYCNQSYLH